MPFRGITGNRFQVRLTLVAEEAVPFRPVGATDGPEREEREWKQNEMLVKCSACS